MISDQLQALGETGSDVTQTPPSPVWMCLWILRLYTPMCPTVPAKMIVVLRDHCLRIVFDQVEIACVCESAKLLQLRRMPEDIDAMIARVRGVIAFSTLAGSRQK